jgi:hypothetical protein
MNRGPKLLVAAAALGAVAAIAIACSDDAHRRTSAAQAQSTGGACEAKAGALPTPDCDNSDNSCAPQPGCTIEEARCGSKSTCLPIGDNKGKSVLDFRIRRLNIAAPPALASDFIQNTVVTLNIDLAEKSCGELGKGLFTWLLRVDKTAGTLVTGGAPPADDPLGQGFCFASFTSGANQVAPITSKIEFSGDTFKTLEDKDVNIPIFLANDLGSVVLLPISKVRIEGVTISADGDCIGSINPDALDPSCADDRSLCSKWRTAGSLGGYITLEAADTVKIRDLNDKSVCSLLAGESASTCPRDGSGQILYKGDFCSKDQQPGSCGDSVWLAATFAASAAKIFDGKGTVPGCSGAVTNADAGADAAEDAPSDAPDDGG